MKSPRPAARPLGYGGWWMEDATWWDEPGDLVLSIDEHSFRGQDLLITVALQAPDRRLLAILGDDRLRSLEPWFAQIPADVRARIRAVTVDLKRAYARVVRRWCPNAQVLADPFHLIQDAYRRLDATRVSNRRKAGRRFPAGRWSKGANASPPGNRRRWPPS